MINPDGSFSFTDDVGNSFIGNFSASQVSGTYVDYLGYSGSFLGTKSSSEGNFVNVSGFYTGSAQGNFTYGSAAGQFYGNLRVLVDATGKSFSLLLGTLKVGGAVYAWVATGGFINLSSDNKIDGYLLDGTHVTGTFDPVNPKGSGSYYYSSGTYTNSGTWSVALRYSLGSTFVDVSRTHWAYDYVDKLVESGITQGCSQGWFCPENTVTRAEMAVFLERAMQGSGYTPPAASGIFADVPVSYWSAGWIEQFYKDGITNGCSSNPLKYCPDNAITRAENGGLAFKS